MPTIRSARPKPVLTGRAMVLGAVLVLLLVVLASPVRRYLASRGAVAGSARQLHDDRTELTRLQAEQARYGDPGYIQAQARTRLEYAMPGDTVFVVVDRGAKTDIEKTSADARAAARSAAWNDRLMDSVLAAAK